MWRQAQDCEYLTFEHLDAVPRLAHGIFTRRGGFSAPPFDGLNLSGTTGDDPASVRRNRKAVEAALGLPIVAARPVHGADVVVIDDALVARALALHRGTQEAPGAAPIALREHLRGVSADAMVTNLPDFALCWAYGDCAPIVLSDPGCSVVALVHAGWRGAAAGVVGRAVTVMRERFGCQPEHLLAGIGPSIGACCYAVGPEVRTAFAADPAIFETTSFVERDGGNDSTQLYLDVAATSERQLRAAGIARANIAVSGYCTGCSPDLFYSNRRGPRHGGRFGVAVGLRPVE
ncbi:MAG TPA: polyphenol oxidase family protein [Ktedonobacterales bacterium]